MIKKTKNITSIAAFTFFILLAFGSEDSPIKEKKNSNNQKSECLNDSYSSGYDAGKLTLIMQSTGTCEDFVNGYNQKTGRNILKADKCYCEGFNDGAVGVEKKYSNKEIESGTTEVSTDKASSIIDDYIKHENQKLNNNYYEENKPIDTNNEQEEIFIEEFESEENQYGE